MVAVLSELMTWEFVSNRTSSPSSGLRSRKLGWNPDSELTYSAAGSHITLPETGDYIVKTNYRMGSAMGPYTSLRYVTVMFTAR